MAKLYPPIIEGTLPAFYRDDNSSNGATILVVPFTMNKTVSESDYDCFSLKLKTLNNNLLIYTVSSKDKDAKFEISNSKLDIGYYKVQIAYQSQGIVGEYSSVGVIKCTNKPDISIKDLVLENTNRHQYKYTGEYSNSDTTEKIYSYCFNIYSEDRKTVIYTTGDQIHNNNLDKKDTFTYMKDLNIDKLYYVEYCVKTINNLEVSSGLYPIVQRESIDPFLKDAKIHTKIDYENGAVELRFSGVQGTEELDENIVGQFKVLRSCEDDNYTEQYELFNFQLIEQPLSIISYKDYTVEQGKSYKYALQEYHTNDQRTIESNKSINTIVQADFEHAYLSDGERQLKIKYNPKISSFKDTLLETKTNTIGSKYPFFFRNGNVKYKEFPISGLISCHSDEDFLFISQDKISTFDGTSNLTGDNVYAERVFKMEVLEWLNNGKPKLFRSPKEGNYIVRLMNTSLSPNDTLGRMIHTFSTTATEVADYNYSNLLKYGFAKVESKDFKGIFVETIDLSTRSVGENIIKGQMLSFWIDNVDNISLKIDGSSGEYKKGETYKKQAKKVELESETSGLFTYVYLIEPQSLYSHIKSVQFINSGKLFSPFKDEEGNDIELINNKKEPIRLIELKANKNSDGSDYTFELNGVNIDISKSNSYIVNDIDFISLSSIGDGVDIELEYEYNEIEYDITDEELEVILKGINEEET